MAKVMAWADVADQVDQTGDFWYTVQWYYDQGKVTMGDDGLYNCSCLVCRQKFANENPTLIVTTAEGCRTSHVHDKGVTF